MTIETHNTNPIKSTTKPRRWFRFRLRTLLVMVTVLSVPLGWVGWELDQRRREKEVVAWMKELGGEAYFHFYFLNDARNWWEKTTDQWFGERVAHLEFLNGHVSDLSPLTELKNLEVLYLAVTQVSDLSPLVELKNLEILRLNDTQVSNEQLQELRWALPNCQIDFESTEK